MNRQHDNNDNKDICLLYTVDEEVNKSALVDEQEDATLTLVGELPTQIIDIIMPDDLIDHAYERADDDGNGNGEDVNIEVAGPLCDPSSPAADQQRLRMHSTPRTITHYYWSIPVPNHNIMGFLNSGTDSVTASAPAGLGDCFRPIRRPCASCRGGCILEPELHLRLRAAEDEEEGED